MMIAALILGAFSVPSAEATPFTFTDTGSMGTARLWHTATLLRDGKVMVTGGGVAGEIATAELYDPVSGTWKATGSLRLARAFHTATLLPNGKV